MLPLLFKQNKGIYSLITTFLFIMIVLFVVLAFMYMGSYLSQKKQIINDGLAKYDEIIQARNRILSSECHGKIITQEGSGSSLAANETCDIPEGFIKGYEIVLLKYHNCSNKTLKWSHIFSSEESQDFVYFVPIKHNESASICPGLLKVKY